MLVSILIMIIIILSTTLVRYCSNIDKKNNIEKKEEKNKMDINPNIKNTKTVELDDYSKVDFRSDFDKNILPLIEANISDFIINDVRTFLKSDRIKYCTIDGFWLMNRKEFLNKVASKIPKRMLVYFITRYMDGETFYNYMCSRVEELAIIAIANEYKNTPPLYKPQTE